MKVADSLNVANSSKSIKKLHLINGISQPCKLISYEGVSSGNLESPLHHITSNMKSRAYLS